MEQQGFDISLYKACLELMKNSSTDSYFNSTDTINCDDFIKPDQMQGYDKNYDSVTDWGLIIAFSCLIIFGAAGNGLVCYVVIRNPHMRTPRNVFIINLAISDLILCLFTQPLNLMKLRRKVWTLGDIMCKLIPFLAGTNVFVSTMSITAIALDRLHMIVYPTEPKLCTIGIAVILAMTWITSATMATPLQLFSVLKFTIFGNTCVENESLRMERVSYSIAAMVFQYIMPMLMLSFAHARICKQLHKRKVVRRGSASSASAIAAQSPYFAKKRAEEKRRKRKTNLLLVMIAVVFAVSWLPLNIFNMLVDLDEELFRKINQTGLVFPICHLLVLCSACANPVLYGWLNENFKKEFVKVFMCGRQTTCRGAARVSRNTNGLLDADEGHIKSANLSTPTRNTHKPASSACGSSIGNVQ